MSGSISTQRCEKSVTVRLHEIALDRIKVVAYPEHFSVVLKPIGTNKIEVSEVCDATGPAFGKKTQKRK